MAKKKNDESLDTGKEFMKFKKGLSPEEQMLLDELGINSFPKLMQMSAMFGLDLDKATKFAPAPYHSLLHHSSDLVMGTAPTSAPKRLSI